MKKDYLTPETKKMVICSEDELLQDVVTEVSGNSGLNIGGSSENDPTPGGPKPRAEQFNVWDEE